MIKPFQAALSEAMERTGDDVGQIAARAGVPTEELLRVLSDPAARLDITAANAVARHFGTTLAGFLEAPELKAQLEIAHLYSQLPDPLKRRFQASRQAIQPASDLSDPG